MTLPLSKSAQRKEELEVVIEGLGRNEAEDGSLMVMELAKKYTTCGWYIWDIAASGAVTSTWSVYSSFT